LTRGTKKSSGVGAIYGYFKPATASSTPATTAASDSEVDGQQQGVPERPAKRTRLVSYRMVSPSTLSLTRSQDGSMSLSDPLSPGASGPGMSSKSPVVISPSPAAKITATSTSSFDLHAITKPDSHRPLADAQDETTVSDAHDETTIVEAQNDSTVFDAHDSSTVFDAQDKATVLDAHDGSTPLESHDDEDDSEHDEVCDNSDPLLNEIFSNPSEHDPDPEASMRVQVTEFERHLAGSYRRHEFVPPSLTSIVNALPEPATLPSGASAPGKLRHSGAQCECSCLHSSETLAD
jgi:hypothetical protein